MEIVTIYSNTDNTVDIAQWDHGKAQVVKQAPTHLVIKFHRHVDTNRGYSRSVPTRFKVFEIISVGTHFIRAKDLIEFEAREDPKYLLFPQPTKEETTE